MSESGNDVAQVMNIDNQDWFLQSLINIVNTEEMSFGITLNVGGLLVSGTLIGGQHYFEGFGSDFSGGDESAENLKKAFAKYSNIYTQEKEDKQKSPRYIHLQDAQFFNTSGNPIPSNKGVWWRGRVSEVSGFMLGSLSSDHA